MSIRPFSWHDLYILYRYRKQVLCLDSALGITRGSPLGLPALAINLAPSRGSYRGISTSTHSDPTMIGQMHFNKGERSAHMDFIAPESAAASVRMTALLESFAVQAGEWGAFYLLAETEEHSPVFEALRRASFSVYAWQRIWKLPAQPSPQPGAPRRWTVITSEDEIAVRSLFQSLLPPLVQSAEQLTGLDSRGLVYKQDGEVLAYVEGLQGPLGIYLLPIIHPSIENLDDLLKELPSHMPRLKNRPVLLAVRSYQSWLEPALEDMCAQVNPRQVLMAKHLAKVQPVAVPVSRLAVLETRHPEPSAPIVQNLSTHKN